MDDLTYQQALDHLLSAISILMFISDDCNKISVTPLQSKVLTHAIEKLQVFPSNFKLEA